MTYGTVVIAGMLNINVALDRIYSLHYLGIYKPASFISKGYVRSRVRRGLDERSIWCEAKQERKWKFSGFITDCIMSDANGLCSLLLHAMFTPKAWSWYLCT